MEIIFTGTGSGKACLERYHSSIVIKTQDTCLLTDTGDGISRALLKAKIEPELIDVILITHTHADHFCGLPSLITQMKMKERTEVLKIIVNHELVKPINTLLKQCFILEERLGFELQIIPIYNNEKIFLDDSLSFLTKQNSHLDKYSKNNTNKDLCLSSNSILFCLASKTVLYTGDIAGINDIYLFDLKPDYLISEITHIEEPELLKYIDEIKPGKVYLTHIDDEVCTENSFTELKKRHGVVFADDGMRIVL